MANKPLDVIKENIDIEKLVRVAFKVPGIKVNREKFLKKELKKYYPEETVQLAIKKNPAYAGVSKECVQTIAKQVINFETNKVSAISFAAGIPGGFAMAATIPADITQYFAFLLRGMQKLAYIYGFEDFQLNEDEIDEDTLNQLLIFLGVMFGVQGANTIVKKLAASTAARVSKTLAQKALTKGVIYPIAKKVLKQVGIKLTKQIFANGVGKIIPVAGGIICGGLSYVSFKPCLNKLKSSFEELQLWDPEYYKDSKKKK